MIETLSTQLELRRSLHREMLRVRAVEERIASRYAEAEMRCPVHLSIGQEAIAVGVSASLRAQDYVLSTHRSHAHYLAKGGDLRRFIAEVYGRATGCCGGHGGSMHLIDLSVNMLGSTPIVGNIVPVAAGVAFSTWLRGGDEVTVVYLGDGATEEGTFAESLNFASLHRLPIVFVVEDNGFSVYSPLSVRQASRRSVVALGRAHGVEGIRGDGNDVERVLALARAAVDHARSGAGPYVLELETYRWREHCGPGYDNDLGYRSITEFDEWKARDPIAQIERSLRADGILDDSALAAMQRDLDAEVDDAFEFARNSPFPDAADFGHVFATPLT